MLATDPTTAIIAGSLLSFAGVVASVLLTNRHRERREAVTDRREEDKERREELAACHATIDALRDINAALQAHNAALTATLMAKDIKVPPIPTPLFIPTPD